MEPDVIVERKITSYRNGNRIETTDKIVKEFPLAIKLNGTEIISLMCLPVDLIELAIGFLYSDGLIDDNTIIKTTNLDMAKGLVEITAENTPSPKITTSRIITSGCGKGSIFQQSLEDIKYIEIKTDIKLKPSTITELMKEMQAMADIFKSTGGVHSCALATCQGSITHFFEDIGRHNAIDKIFGACLLQNLELDSSIVLTSGRVSSEIIIKIAKRRIPFVISRSAPTDFALDLAAELGVCVVGFMRGERFSVYTETERIA